MIHEGEVLITKKNRSKSILKLGPGDSFNEESLLNDKNPCFSAISQGFSSLYTISLNDFVTTLKSIPADYVIMRILNYFK